jgi:hypothetical protein
MSTTIQTWKGLAQAGKLEEAILAYIEAYDYTTFAELQLRLGEHCDMSGPWAIEACPNGFLWAGMSEEFQQAFRQLREQGSIEVVPADPLCYLIDGMFPKYPIAKRVPRDKAKGYAKPYWLPVCLRPAKSNGAQPLVELEKIAKKEAVT